MILCVFIFITCSNKEKTNSKYISTVKYEQFSGELSCAKCHKDIYEAHIKTSHYLTSQIGIEKNIKGSFEAGKNTFSYNPSVYISMEKRRDSLYQVEYVNGIEKTAKPFDFVVGSGKRGQTFMYWNKNNLFQLPITYFTSAGQWSNSPGYSNKVIFRRPITSRCLECHSTYFNKISDAEKYPEEFSKTDIVLGVSCERCHGPGAKHVEFHTKNPDQKIGQYILNPKTFTRQQSLDMCRVCHGGKLSKSKPSFEFKAGDTLANFFATDSVVKSVADMDVHGNQFGMLSASKCFNLSEMTCSSCHSAHDNEIGKLEVFSQRCMNCHSVSKNNFCKMVNQVSAEKLKKNCIDCHMPEQSSRAIMVLLQGQSIPTSAVMRSHFISIYPEETKQILSGVKNGKNKMSKIVNQEK